MLDHGECTPEALEHGFNLFGSARNVVVLAIRIDDSQTGRIDPGRTVVCQLVEVSRWIHGDSSGVSVELVAIEIQEIEQKFTQSALLAATLTLLLWHKLEHADDKTDDCEATNSTTVDLIQAAHGKQLFDNYHQLRRFRIVMLPIAEGFNRSQSRVVLKGDVDLQISLLINEFQDGNLGLGDNNHGVLLGDPV